MKFLLGNDFSGIQSLHYVWKNKLSLIPHPSSFKEGTLNISFSAFAPGGSNPHTVCPVLFPRANALYLRAGWLTHLSNFRLHLALWNTGPCSINMRALHSVSRGWPLGAWDHVESGLNCAATTLTDRQSTPLLASGLPKCFRHFGHKSLASWAHPLN